MTAQASPDPAARRRIRRVFAAVVCGLVFQVAVTAFAGEPYPAIMMPGFPAGANDPDGWFRFESFDIVFELEGGKRELLTVQQFFEGTPSSHFLPIARRVFSPAKKRERQPRSRVGDLAQAPYVSRARDAEPSLLRRVHGSRHGRVAAPARRAALPDRHVERVRFEWYNDALKVTAGKAERTRKPLGVREVDLR